MSEFGAAAGGEGPQDMSNGCRRSTALKLKPISCSRHVHVTAGAHVFAAKRQISSRGVRVCGALGQGTQFRLLMMIMRQVGAKRDGDGVSRPDPTANSRSYARGETKDRAGEIEGTNDIRASHAATETRSSEASGQEQEPA